MSTYCLVAFASGICWKSGEALMIFRTALKSDYLYGQYRFPLIHAHPCQKIIAASASAGYQLHT